MIESEFPGPTPAEQIAPIRKLLQADQPPHAAQHLIELMWRGFSWSSPESMSNQRQFESESVCQSRAPRTRGQHDHVRCNGSSISPNTSHATGIDLDALNVDPRQNFRPGAFCGFSKRAGSCCRVRVTIVRGVRGRNHARAD